MTRSWGVRGALRFMAAGLLAPVSCGTAATSETAKAQPECAEPAGRYEIVYAELAGTCGRIPRRILQAPSQRVTSFLAPCSGKVEYSPDGCQARFHARCPSPNFGAGFRNEQHSRSTSSRDGKRRSGLLQMSVFRADGSLHCRSIYDVSGSLID